MKSLLKSVLAICVVGLLLVQVGTAAEKSDPIRILFVTQSAGFVHGVVKRDPDQPAQLAAAEIALIQLGQQSGLFTVDCTQDCAADFTRENLQNYDIVAFYTTLDLPIAQEDLDYFLNDWLRQKGHGFLGFHSAGDTFHEYEPYWDMVGGTFIGHPWTQDKVVTLKVHDQSHPGATPYGSEFTHQDEIYMYRHWQPEKVRVLMSLDYSQSPTNNAVPTDHGYHVPVCWVKEYGDGKVYFNNLGHRPETWTNRAFLDSILGAVKWLHGDLEGNATPNPEVSADWEQKSKRDFVQYGFKRQEPKPKTEPKTKKQKQRQPQ